jgi:hypothetical protein
MAMGILQALKLQEGPIESLAQLPQQQLIAMSQQGRIPADVLPIILNEKAQMAQAAANMQAMQQPMQPSVIEQAMAINAQSEAPQMAPQEMPEDSGVASLPVPDDMYSDEGYAGGGIVAFETGGLTKTFSNNRPVLSATDLNMFMPETQYAPVGRDLSRDFKDTDTGVDLPPVAAAPRAAAPRPDARPEPGIAAIPTKESMLDRRRRMLEQMGVTDTTEAELAEMERNKGKLADDKFDALRMSLIRAGLGMAAGTSPYALTNIAKGGIEGFDTYEQSIKQIKAEEKEYGKLARGLRKEANAVKRSDVDKALDLESKAELMDIEKKKLAATVRAAEKTPAEIQLIERYAKDKGINFSQAMREISGLKAEPKSRDAARKEWAGDVLLRRQYPEFEDYYKSTSVSGGGAVPGVKFLGVR